jgi:hypothetical protein
VTGAPLLLCRSPFVPAQQRKIYLQQALPASRILISGFGDQFRLRKKSRDVGLAFLLPEPSATGSRTISLTKKS